MEQRLDPAPAGAYLARCWVKSPTEQPVTFLLQDSGKPWAAYALAEIRVPAGQWVQLKSFCALNHNGSLTLALGGRSKEFNLYHGTAGEMGSPIIADDFELIRYEPKAAAKPAVWDAKTELGPAFDWSAKNQWLPVDDSAHVFAGTPVIQGRHLAGAVRQSDGGLAVYSVQEGRLKQRCVIAPEPAFAASRCTMVRENGRRGIRVSAAAGRSFLHCLVHSPRPHPCGGQQRAAVSSAGLPPALRSPAFVCRNRPLLRPGQDAGRQGLLHPFHAMVCRPGGRQRQPARGRLGDGLAVSLGLSGEGAGRLIDSLSIAPEKEGFSLSFAEHAGIWHREPLNEDWLGEYVPIAWTRPFPARWMGRFFVTPGGPPSFREPCMEYSFPIAHAKTRMWGVWFEDWNHYPFSFDGPRAILSFREDFRPQRRGAYLLPRTGGGGPLLALRDCRAGPRPRKSGGVVRL